MHLSRIRLAGFKSFCADTAIDFFPGVTAIVGPNGCGKTNVADAVRWVLGEQKLRNLRGEKLEDVIFKGTSKRKPVGMAEVEITLTGAEELPGFDLSEVSITRRAFRDGTSQFLIGRQPVRLRDITDLLMDTGLGVDGYAVIEGKAIDMMLLSSPGERKHFFEEAAGVSKYKVRRRSAENKLESVQNDLVRIGDIVRDSCG